MADIFGVSGHGQTGTIDIIIGSMTVSGVFGWIWSIANVLHKKLPDGQRFKLWIFRILFLIALTILICVFWTIENNTLTDKELPFILLCVPIYLGLMIFVVLFSAKTLKTIELGRPTSINEYGVEAFLIWMIPIGVWFIQPRLNQLTED